ncbi:MAG: Protein-disulfide isomerase [Candidatus Shapirobacteria bacterium GW2011_GWE1_38_10]|uniref:Protein-disulfide isomerase n=1 Tax=Candidatus Shapirobacteria bacterium GW2011_GWE1_38_10 TaxID=1618488 RepID=A0A0G0HZ30_9BACT|nr:MAG: Protein-disulfide isomerase [Candidatus Shapirobacteria bacterium GW2011_GWE1_38_10]
MLKDKFVLSIIGVTILIMVGAVFYFSKIDSSATVNPDGSVAVSDENKKLLEVVSDDYIKGNKDATVTLVEYLDFECEACGAYYPLVKQLSEEFKNDVRFVNRYFPLPGHKNGMPAALAVEAAARQGKYWEMHDLLFDNQKSWGEKQTPDPAIFEGYAKQVGLNMDQYKKDVASPEVRDRVNRDKNSGTKIGVSGTPSFYLNGEKIPNPKTIADFKTFIQAAILKAPKQTTDGAGEKVHEHADLALFINGTKTLLQSRPEFFEKDPDIHSHKDTEEVIHKHKTGVTLGQLIDSWKTNLPNKVEWYLNGSKQNDDFRKYEFKDLDRITLSFSDSDFSPTTKQISEVTDRACVYSEKCPERGKPPTENCVGGLGTDC